MSTWIFKRYLWIFILVAIVSSIGWFFYLSERVSDLVDNAGVGLPNASFPISVMPLYEIGLFAGVCVMVVACALVLARKFKSLS